MDNISFDHMTALAGQARCIIGICSDPAYDNVSKSIEECRTKGLDSVVPYSNPEDLINDLMADKIDAAVRGNIPATFILELLKNKTGSKKISRLVLLRTVSGKYFFMAPVGIDEGKDLESKLEIVKHSIELFNALDINVRIGVLSVGRADDKGRSKEIDEGLMDAEALDKKLRSSGYDSTNYGILIEEAILRSNLILVPDGIIGNYIFRTLYHLGDGDSIGAPVINISRTFIDTSRTKKNYSSSIILAAALHNARQ